MDLTVVGLNHRTAPVSLRERVAFDSNQLADVLPAIKEGGRHEEVAILSTCNRTEIMVYTNNKDPNVLVEWLAEYHSIPIV